MTGRLLDRKEAAALLGVSERTVRRMGANGDLDEIRVSERLIRITAESVERYIGSSSPAAAWPPVPAPVSRVLHGELSLAAISCKPSRDALRKAVRDASDSQMVWITRRDGQRIGAIVSVGRAEYLEAMQVHNEAQGRAARQAVTPETSAP